MTRYSSSSRLLTPPRREEEVYPYRRVWPSIIIEVGVVFGIALAMYILSGFLGVNIPDSLKSPFNLMLALIPAVIWSVMSRWRESRVLQPRRGLLAVFVISALVANAIAIPILNVIDPAEWLSLSGVIGRIIGNTVTIGVTHEFLKYIVLRYTIWPNRLRTRLDTIAYSTAASIGYATVLNLRLVLNNAPDPDVVAINVFVNVGLHVATGAIVAYGLSEMHFKPRSFLLMPFTLLLASLVQGITITMRSNLVNASFFLGSAGTRPLFGLVFALVIVIAVLPAMAFMFNNAEREEREATVSQEG